MLIAPLLAILALADGKFPDATDLIYRAISADE
jgi:hypothetical protein